VCYLTASINTPPGYNGIINSLQANDYTARVTIDSTGGGRGAWGYITFNKHVDGVNTSQNIVIVDGGSGYSDDGSDTVYADGVSIGTLSSLSISVADGAIAEGSTAYTGLANATPDNSSIPAKTLIPIPASVKISDTYVAGSTQLDGTPVTTNDDSSPASPNAAHAMTVGGNALTQIGSIPSITMKFDNLEQQETYKTRAVIESNGKVATVNLPHPLGVGDHGVTFLGWDDGTSFAVGDFDENQTTLAYIEHYQ